MTQCESQSKREKMGKYLSIGEVVKMKGVSHRALRHYDDLGILVPAYTNPETKYRYYSKTQIIILDIITLCVALGIPLKHFKNYILENGSFDAKQMIADAKIKALQVQKELDQKLYFLHSASEHFTDLVGISQQNNIYTKHISQRYFLTIPAPEDFGTYEDYWTKLTILYKTALKNGFALSVNQGLCFYLKDGCTQVRYFVEIQKPTRTERENPDILIIPKAEFLCECFEDKCFFDALEKYQAHELYLAGNIFILSDILEASITQKAAPFEIQLLLK